jgi:tetratricopeptide (TPR) repeat protein
MRLAALGAIAAILLISLGVLRARHQAERPSVAAMPAAPAQQPVLSGPVPSNPAPSNPAQPLAPALAQLADLALPPFQASHLRGENRNPQFEAGMKAYASQDCARAVKTLVQVPAADEDARGARFYSGVCLMQQGDLADAAERLRSVANAGDSPQQEAAFYYLAQIALANNDAAAARRSLGHAVQLHGDFEARAQAELSRIGQTEGR